MYLDTTITYPELLDSITEISDANGYRWYRSPGHYGRQASEARPDAEPGTVARLRGPWFSDHYVIMGRDGRWWDIPHWALSRLADRWAGTCGQCGRRAEDVGLARGEAAAGRHWCIWCGWTSHPEDASIDAFAAVARAAAHAADGQGVTLDRALRH